MESMKSRLAAMMIMGAMMEGPPMQRISKGKGNGNHSKLPLTSSQKRARAKTKAAKQARKANRK